MIEQLARDFPDQCTQAAKQTISLSFTKDDITAIVCVGMGGSGMPASLIKDAFDVSLPVLVIKDEVLPAFADEKTLLIPVSYSGNTYETLAVFKEGLNRGCKIAGVTSGGELLRLLEEHNLPFVRVPDTIPLQRMSVGWQFFAIAAIFSALKLVDRKRYLHIGSFLAAHQDQLQQRAAELASQFDDKLLVVYSTAPAIVTRCLGQFNENAKQLVHGSVCPELNHNEINAFQTVQKHVRVLRFRLDTESEKIKTAYAFFADTVTAQGVPLIDIPPLGATKLEQLFAHVYLTDLLSIALAKQWKIDAETIPLIGELKRRLGT
ncbi:MAG: hypothetical protein KKA90_00615 [Nanoarchaeota archaeon]|nr:hypothetical protein [Nanoarchaeota archaeon]